MAAMPESMKQLAAGALELGIELTERQLAQFEAYYQELHQWNQRVNLTAITEYSEVQVKHFLDSLTCCLAYPGGLAGDEKVIDIGAGAGFPGLPLKLVFPDLRLTLSDSVGKKTAFLRHLLEMLELPEVVVLTARAEQLGRAPETRERFDLVLARGVAKMPALLEYTLPLCRIGGRVVAWKHGGIQQELESAEAALNMLGGRWGQTVPVALTGLTDNRILVTVEKVSATPAEYPRRPGLPAKQPL